MLSRQQIAAECLPGASWLTQEALGLQALIKACLAHEADDRPQPSAIVTALQHICKTAKTAALANGIASQPGFADFLNY